MYLETQRLILRNLKGTDLQAYLRFRNSEFVLRYNAMARQSTEEAEEYIRNNLTNDLHVAIARKDTDAFVGMIYVEQDSLRYKANSLQVSYWLGEPYSAQ
ncbi:MAG: GNAT family N-acetyltransferase, partial [Clostridiales bacterium]|nr:GNAT family N-acetyltransferase [Clostridiales bacterium]